MPNREEFVIKHKHGGYLQEGTLRRSDSYKRAWKFDNKGVAEGTRQAKSTGVPEARSFTDDTENSAHLFLKRQGYSWGGEGGPPAPSRKFGGRHPPALVPAALARRKPSLALDSAHMPYCPHAHL